MVWVPGDGYRYLGRRADGWPDDSHAPDGYLVGGFRKVRKGGVILASGSRWQDDALIPFVGKMVRYDLVDPLSIEINVYVGAHAKGVEVTPWNYLDYRDSFYEAKDFIRPTLIDETAHSKRTINNMRKKGYNV